MLGEEKACIVKGSFTLLQVTLHCNAQKDQITIHKTDSNYTVFGTVCFGLKGGSYGMPILIKGI